MANRTQRGVASVKGTNPQYLVEKIIRMRVYDARYWKEECFALSADLIVDKGIQLRYIGGVYAGNVKTTPFLCLLLKMLQIGVDKHVAIEYVRQEDFKYLRALGAMFVRMTCDSAEVYKYLEPLFNDYRKLRFMNNTGVFSIMHVDELVDSLLREERVCDVHLPRLQRRHVLEAAGEVEPRVSVLDEQLAGSDDEESSSDDEAGSKAAAVKRSPSRSRSHSPVARSKDKSSRDKERDRDRDRDRNRDKARDRDRERERDRDRRTAGSSSARRSSPPHDSSKRSDRLRFKDKSGGKQRDSTRGKAEDERQREIREANELRAKLGLPPLEQ